MKIGILAVQGAFLEHENMLAQIGIDCFEIRKKEDLNQEMQGLILPGGESTTMTKILQDLNMVDIIKKKILMGLPILATCAGMILLAENIVNQESNGCFGTMPISVHRNAYGRQLGSFVTTTEVKYIGNMTLRFIRAPYIEAVDKDVDILAVVDKKIVAVQYRNQIALSFHPELTQDVRFHKYFIKLAQKYDGMEEIYEKK